MEVEHVNLADRVTRALVERDAQEGSRRRHSKLRGVLAKVLERGERLGALLNLVKYDEGLAGDHPLPTLRLDHEQDAGQVIAHVKLRGEAQVVVEIDVGDALEVPRAELHEQPGLPNLSGTIEHKRLPANGVLPSDEVIHKETFHDTSKRHTIRTFLLSSRMVIIRT